MAASARIKISDSSARLGKIVDQFWSKVNGQLVRVHRVRPSKARDAVRLYRKRVGDVALNRGAIETAQDIAIAVRSGGFRSRNVSSESATQLPRSNTSRSKVRA